MVFYPTGLISRDTRTTRTHTQGPGKSREGIKHKTLDLGQPPNTLVNSKMLFDNILEFEPLHEVCKCNYRYHSSFYRFMIAGKIL